jgi:glucose/arabinose dehydrogenase/PKD repeat protein
MGNGFRTHPRAAQCVRAMMVVTATAVALVAPAHATTLPAGFQESTAFSGLTQPMAIEFAPNGRVFVAEKSGIIKTYASLADTSATQFADLRTKVHNYWDRGLMSIAVDPNFPAEPWVYVYYVHDAAIGGTAPRWGQPNQTDDTCPTPPGGTGDGCVVSGRISRLQVSGEAMTGPEQVLIENFCQQYPSHAGGGLEFGADGYLYYSGGEGASWIFADYGQDGNPVNPCGDPPGGVGGPMSPPTAEGGRLRSQDIRSSSDPLGLSGAVIRIDPDTGAGVPGNPLFSSANANERRIIAYGTRNAFRLAIRPGAGDVWVGDVGAATWEEIDRVTTPFGGPRNLGWPCYEGGLDSSGNPASLRFGEMDNLNLNLCESLYSAGTAVAPHWAYRHGQKIVAGENCLEGAGSALSGLAFAPPAGGFPDSYDGALFFADHERQCIWALRADANGLPDPTQRVAFAQAADFPVDLEFGPIGDLFYPDIAAGNIRKINYTGNPSNLPPTAVATASPQSGNVPLQVNFSGTESTDPNPGDTLSYAWDLDDDNQLDDSTSATPSFNYTTSGVYTVTLRVTDLSGAFDEDTVTINADSAPPTPSIDTPVAGTTWGVDQALAFSGSATDPEDGTLPGTALDWTWIMHHCTSPGNCHTHTIETIPDTAGGTFFAPDHDYPSHLELRLTATDSDNNAATVSRQLDPRTVDITVASDTPGATVSLRSTSGPAPVTATVIEGSANTISTPSPQTLGSTTYQFSSWSDGQAQTHNVAPTSSTTYTARFAPIAAGTATLTFNPEADAYVEESSPTANFGGAATLRTDAGGNPGVESYIRFLVDGLAGKVQTAKLRLFSTTNTVDGPAVFSTSNAWAESTINWNNKPAPSGGALSDSGAIATDVWTEWDVTPAVTADGAVSFRLASAVNDGVNFHSRESATVTRRPELVLTVLNDSFPRPKSATPLFVSLVPAYNACTSSNRTHGPPLVHPSCNPPARSSSDLTVGTPDANGGEANSSGTVKLGVVAGTAGPPDEADVTVALTLTDVRHVAGLTDYAGEVQMRGALQITDRANGAAGDQRGTVQVVEVPVNATCAVTAGDPSVGSICGVVTTLDAVVPGIIVEGRRSVWEIGQIEVLDGGPDGDADTPGNGVFARQGVFVP